MACMISILLNIIIFIFIDLIPLYKEKKWMSFWVYATVLGIVFVIALLLAFNIKIPSPADPLKEIIVVIWGI
jgi:putative effector of murein hydrolase